MSSPSSARLQAMGSRNDSDLPLPGFDMQYTLFPWSIMGHARACNGSGEMRSASKNLQILSWSPVEEAGEADDDVEAEGDGGEDEDVGADAGVGGVGAGACFSVWI